MAEDPIIRFSKYANLVSARDYIRKETDYETRMLEFEEEFEENLIMNIIEEELQMETDQPNIALFFMIIFVLNVVDNDYKRIFIFTFHLLLTSFFSRF